MDAKLATNKIRGQQWAAIIKNRIESGLTVTEYCNQHGLSKTQYYYWLRKIRTQVIETQMPQLVEIQPSAPIGTLESISSNFFETEMVLSVGKIKIEMNSSTSPELIKSVLGVLVNA